MAKFDHINEVVESLCIRSGDTLMRNKGLFLEVAEDTWNDMNEGVLKLAQRVKIPVRRLFYINKKTNSLDLPCDALRVSSVNIYHNGIFYPVYRNDAVSSDFVELGQTKNCACEHKCGYHLCNTIKGYEVLFHTETDKDPDGNDVTFDCVDKKVINGGFLYEQKQFPQRVYLSSVWTETVLQTENIKMCAVEVDDNGCPLDTEANINAVCNSCGISNNDSSQCCIGGTASTPPNDTCKTWIYYCTSKLDWFGVQCGSYPFFKKGFNNVYNIDSTGKRLIFPPNFGWDKVVVRMYVDIDLQNLYIPYMAKETFMTGLQYFAFTNNPKKQQEAAVFGDKYSRQKWGLFLDLNKYRLAELRMMTNPPIYVPSYIDHRQDNFGISF